MKQEGLGVKSVTEKETFKVRFVADSGYSPRKVTLLRHNFCEHPLLTMPALARLADRLIKKNAEQVRFVSKETKLDSTFKTSAEAPDEIPIHEVFKNISNPGSWIALWSIQNDPEYNELLWEVVHSVEGDWQAKDPGLFELNGYIFISSPPSVTPFHLDSENNFLLQIRGKKRFGVWQPQNSEVISDEATENWIVQRNLDKVKYQPEYMKFAVVDDLLEAGDGIYMPSTAPHLTHAEEELATSDNPYSITLAVVFFSRRTKKMAYIHSVNRVLRKFGLAPSPPGTHKIIDLGKYLVGKIMVLSQRALRIYSPPSGF